MKSNTLRFFICLAVFASVFLPTACEDEKAPQSPGPDPDPYPHAVDIGDSEIPYIVIDTHDNTILFEPKISATMKIYSGVDLMQETEIGIEYRGKTSYRISNKKGFNIETLNGDVSFFGLPAEEDFRLIGHIVNLTDKYIFDRTLMYNYIGYELARSIGRYAARCKFVELQLNDDYLGVYVFTEKVKRDDNRINIKSLNATSTNNTGGYILKIDKADPGPETVSQPLSYYDNNWNDDAHYTESNSFRSRYDINGNELLIAPFGAPYHPQKYLETYFVYEYPKEEDITAAQKTYIAGYIDQFETALLTDDFGTSTRAYTNFIDLDSFVDFFILNELFRNIDAYRLSTFLQKDRDGKLAMGPVWDLDIAYDNNGDRIPMDDWVANYNNHTSYDAWMVPFWWPRLMEDPQFKAAVKVRWNTLRADKLSNTKLLQLVDATSTMLKDNGAVERNYKVWDKGIGVDYDASINKLKTFLQERTTWMDNTIALFP